MNPFILLSAEETRRADQLTIESGVTGAQLMDNAGKALAHLIQQIVASNAPKPDAQETQQEDPSTAFTKESQENAPAQSTPKVPVLFACGPGNNGGDGFVAARILHTEGWPVKVAISGSRDDLKGDAKLMASLYEGEIVPLTADALKGANLIVDALYGTGLNRAVEGRIAEFINAVNASGLPVISVDIPSGINADTGQVMGTAIRAAFTLTYVTRNPGHILFPGRNYCGQTEIAPIGIPDSVLHKLQPTRMINDIALWGQVWPRPQTMDHKYSRGAVSVLSGEMITSSAARLAARAALRGGAGVVTILSPSDALLAHASHLTSIMMRKADDADQISAHLEDKRIRVVIAGPGLGTDAHARQKIDACLASGKQIVLDADGLSLFQDNPDSLFKKLKPTDIITPHEGEFARLFPDLIDHKHGQLKSAQMAAQRAGCVVVLKGPATIIAVPGGESSHDEHAQDANTPGRAAMNVNAPPDLATAGSGDVLAGFIAGLACQVMPHQRPMPAFEAACGGVWLHGACGQFLGQGLIAEDLPDALPGVLRQLFSTESKPSN